ncbi:MAG TPA: hypothetical protein VK966_01040, partial [Longimicrobiales bacterium]|nr:hypothetical protein [Longimicrobiales bacterium]
MRPEAARRFRTAPILAFALAFAGCAATPEATSDATPAPTRPASQAAVDRGPDPREGLAAGWMDAESAISNMELLATLERPEGFYDATDLGSILLANSDMAYQGDYLYMGNFHGLQVFDVANPANPQLVTALPCPGGQGDVSVYENLLFMSVEMPNGRVDCGEAGSMRPGVDPERFLGVRIFDISDAANPQLVSGVQTCRGSHTHTLVPDESDPANVYVYVSGTSPVRPAAELEGCTALEPEEDPNTSYFRIEVVKVPVDAPEEATIVNEPRIFAADGDVAGLWPGGAHGPGSQTTARTDQCHDITVYPEIGLAAGACSGNGILLDITDPANPERIDEVVDPNFAYWHSATFSNDGSKVIFTDEWGGGMAARCRDEDPKEWGANAIFTLANRELRQEGYYKLPAAQTEAENCVAHNGSLVPVPGRDIKVQAWYQGGVSVFDFTDPENPFEIAYFDRGPMVAGELLLGGYWSAYWYNGAIYGSEIGRGLDVFRLTPSEHLTQNELDAARLVRYETFNPQTQPRVSWPAEFVVARAYLDQLRRESDVAAAELDRIATELDAAEDMADADA